MPLSKTLARQGLALLFVLAAGCSGQAASSSLTSSASVAPSAPKDCEGFLALDSQTKQTLYQSTTVWVSYRDDGVRKAQTIDLYQEQCSKDPGSETFEVALDSWVGERPLCTRFVKLTAAVQQQWITAADAPPSYVTAADYVQACAKKPPSAAISDARDAAREIAIAREPATEKPTTAATTAAPVPASGVAVSTWTDSSGHSIRVTIHVSLGMRANNLAPITSAWSAAGGSGPVACLSNPSSSMVDADRSDARVARVWVGTITYENLTPNYPWTSTAVSWNSKTTFISVGLGFSNGATCDSMNSADRSVNTTGSTSQTIRLPLVLVQSNVFTPNSPNGIDPPLPTIKINGLTSTGQTSFTLPV